MSNSIDDKIVSIKFDNKDFEDRISETLSSIDKLKNSLDFSQAGKGFDTLGAAANSVDLSGMGDAIDNISSKFSALGAIGFSVIQDLTQSALDFAKNLSGEILDPLLAGGKQRATSIQNAQFQFRGLGINVQDAMASALAAVKGTAFGLDEAAAAAAQFGASGVGAGKDMTQALRGIAGAAAITNSSFGDIANIFTSVAGTGKLTNEDLNRFAIRGLNATAVLAKALGKTQAQIHDMAREGKIDFATFSKVMDNAFGAHATEANQTYTGALANLHAALARVGASFFGPQMEQQRDLFNALSPVIDKVNTALQPLITNFLSIRQIGISKLINTLGHIDMTPINLGIAQLSSALSNAFAAFSQFTGIIKTAFRTVFPATKSIGDIFVAITGALVKFTAALKLNTGTAHSVEIIFRGIFDAVSIVLTVISNAARLFKTLFTSLTKGNDAGSAVLKFFENLAIKITLLKLALVNNGGIDAFFNAIIPTLIKFRDKVVDVFDRVTRAIGDFKDQITKTVDTFKGNTGKSVDGVSDSFGRLSDRLGFLSGLARELGKAFDFLVGHLDDIGAGIGKFLGAIVLVVANLGQSIADTLKGGDFSKVFDVLNAGLFTGILVVINRFLHDGFSQLGNGIVGQVSQAFNQLTGTLKAMQTQIRADALIKIAEALAILVGSLLILSLIDSAALSKALLAMSVGFGELVGVMGLLDKVSGGFANSASIAALSVSILAVSAAIVILSVAAKILSTMDWSELAKGLVGVAVLLGAVTLAVNFMPSSIAMIGTGAGIVALAAGILILSGAVKILSTMNWEELAKGLGSVAVALGVITVASNLMDPVGILAAGLALIPLATGLSILTGAIAILGNMDVSHLVEGLVGVGAALVIIAGAMQLMPIDLPITGAGLLLVGIGLNAVATALKLMGSISGGDMAKSLIGISAALVILSIGMDAMSGTIAGSLSLVVAATGLSALAAAIKAFVAIKMGDLAAGIGKLALALGALAIIAVILEPAAGSLALLGAALLLVGAGFALFGIGATAVARALKLIGETGEGAISILIEVFDKVITKIPALAVALAEGLVKIAQVIIKALPGILEQLQTVIPDFGETIGVLIDTLITLIESRFPEIVSLGVNLLISFLQGIADAIPQLIGAVGDIIVNFLTAIASQIPDIVAAGLSILTAFLQGIADNIGQVIQAGANIIGKVIEGITNAILGDGTKDNPGLLKKGTDAVVAFLKGISDSAVDITTAGTIAILHFLAGIAGNAVMFANTTGDIIVSFINGIADAIRSHNKELRAAGANLASAILDGMTFGLSGKVGDVVKGAEGVGKKLIGGVAGVLGIHSPSTVFIGIGQHVIEGLAVGLTNSKMAEEAGVGVAQSVIDRMHITLNKVNEVADTISDIQPVITPVLDLSEVNKGLQGISTGTTTNPVDIDALIKAKGDEIASWMQAPWNTEGGSIYAGPPTTAPIHWGDPNWIDPIDERPRIDALARQIVFQQTINSPTALSVSDIYRGTKTQFSMAKKELQIG